jgi:hypothetical protein
MLSRAAVSSDQIDLESLFGFTFFLWHSSADAVARFSSKFWPSHTGFITSTLGIPTDLCEWLCVLPPSLTSLHLSGMKFVPKYLF